MKSRWDKGVVIEEMEKEEIRRERVIRMENDEEKGLSNGMVCVT